ncbi:MAG: hypothetical protein IJ391_02500 [Clostridia bacterium]|nr:hypothetical protein [Clostridia bacterium]
MKLRALVYSSKGKLHTLASDIVSKYASDVANSYDKIPPAYSCNKERLVIIAATVSKTVDTALERFCKELTSERANNVAFIIDGPAEGADAIKKITAEAGANVIDEVLFVKGGLPFLKGVKPEEKAAAYAWVDRITPLMK